MMILRRSAWRLFKRGCTGIYLNNGQQQIRLASVFSRVYQSFPERPPPTDYLSKYQDKLEKKAKEEGHASVSELREAYKPKVASVKKKMDMVPPRMVPRKLSSTSEKTSSPTSTSTPPAVTPIKTLSSYVDVDKLRQHKDSKDIELIWRAGHTKDNLLCAVIPTPIYQRMTALARDHPMFILPLPRDSGVEIHFMEFKFPKPKVTHIIFTSLLEYKTHGEYARPHTTIMHFEDFSDERGIVLMRGEMDPTLKAVSQDDARLLVMHVQKLYGSDPEHEKAKTRRKLIEDFTKGSGDFDSKVLEKA